MIKIEPKRIEELIKGLAKFNAQPGEGITRLAYSDVDKGAQTWLLKEIEYMGLTVEEDAVGNVFLRRPGLNPYLPPVATGSHLDTVIHGGAYDGMCGVVGALEAVRMLGDEQLLRDIVIVIFRAEESSRFGYATIGSKMMTGSATPDTFDKGAKKGDITFKEALKQWGCKPEDYAKAIKQPGAFKSFTEIHIEQGKVLEELKIDLGIVHNIAAPTRFKIHIKGMADHSGATPMGMRKDALVSAAKLVLAVEDAATEEKGFGTVGTVGVVELDPGSINVVPGKATLWVDVRGVLGESIKRCVDEIVQCANAVAVNDRVGVDIEMLTSDKPVALSDVLAKQSEAICKEKGFSFLHMNSGAGHDAMHMAKLCPTTMLFIPCKGGISHNPAEYAKNEDICRAVEVLAEILKREASN